MLPTSPADNLDYSLVFIVIGAGCFLRAVCEDLETYLSGLLSPGYVNYFKSLWLFINRVALFLICIDFVLPYLRLLVDCFAASYVLRTLSHFGSSGFGLEVQELVPS